MGIFDHLKHLIEDEIRGGHHGRRHHGGHHGGHHYDDHYYDPHCDPNYAQPRQPQRGRAPSPQSAAAMPCPKCGRFNPSHVLFCQQCGQSLAGDGDNIICSGCSAQLAPDAKFCGQCGQPQV